MKSAALFTAVFGTILFILFGMAAGASAYNRFAYITNYNSNNVSVIDTSTFNVVTTIPVGNGPFGVAVNAAGTRAYVTDNGSANLSVIDTSTNAVVATIPATWGGYPGSVAVSPDGARAYVTGGNSYVSVINTSTYANLTTISDGPASDPGCVAVNPTGTRVYVANYNTNTVSVIDTSSNTVIATIGVGTPPLGIAVSYDGKKVYVADGNAVSVIDAATNTVAATINTSGGVQYGFSAEGLAVSPDDSKVYVACGSTNNVLVIDTATDTITDSIPVGTDPNGIALTPDGAKVFVANYVSNDVSVIDTSTDTVIATIPVGTNPEAFGQFIVPAYLPFSNITSPSNNAVLAGADYTITGTATDTLGLGIKEVEVGITPLGGSITDWSAATDTSGSGTWATWSYDWTLPADGQYVIESRATYNGGVEVPGKPVTVMVDNTVPYITGISPAAGIEENTPITLTGFNFGASAGYVRVIADGAPSGARAAKITNWAASGNSITFLSPMRLRAGTYNAYVVKGGIYASNKEAYRVASPSITGSSLDNGAAGDTLTLTGEYFGTDSRVVFLNPYTWGIKAAKISGTPTDTSISLTVPVLKAGVYDMVVVNGQGWSNPYSFEVGLPTISGVSPSSGTPGSTINITGGYFGYLTPTVLFVSAAGKKVGAKVTAHSDTGITVKVPAVVKGAYNITVKSVAGTSSGWPFTVN